MYFILGVIVGLLVNRRDSSTTYTRTVNQLGSKLKPKGNIIEPEAEDLDKWVKSLNI